MKTLKFEFKNYYLYLIKCEECCILFCKLHGMIGKKLYASQTSLKCIVPIFHNILGLQKKLNLAFEIFLVF